MIYSSGECEVDLVRRELRMNGFPVPLGARAFEIVEVLAQSAGELVTKDELMSRIWPGAAVMENTLQVHAAAVRKALGPYRDLLKTEAGRGYRLLGDWTARRHDAARAPAGLRRARDEGESGGTNLPASVIRLIGRAPAMVQLRDLISAYRVVTLTGPGGIGKTSLALDVARGIASGFADGGWLVELASLSDPDLVPAATAAALRLRMAVESVTPDTVARAIGDRELLVVIDNCEHLIGAAATLAETLVQLCPHIAILATSREALRIQGEYVFHVPPLEVPGVEQVESGRILEHSAPALFIARTGELGPDISADRRSLSLVAMICRHLDGIPLAIEFAAARATTLGVEQVALGLRDRFALLTTGRRTALPRHRTLRATLDWSYQLLTEAERELLRRLSIFVGPFSLEAAVAVADAAATPGTVAAGVADLIARSLVFSTADPAATEFRLLETTRVYALDRLAEAGALASVARRHAEFLLHVLDGIADQPQPGAQHDHFAARRRLADEIHAALDWAFSGAGEPGIGVAVTIAAIPVWFEIFQMAAARTRAEQALRHAKAGSDQEMRLHIALGHALWHLDPQSDIEPLFARALDVAERIGDRSTQMRALWGIWAARRGRGDFAGALEVASRYSTAAADAGDPGAMHLADRILALTHHFLGQLRRAREFAERALQQPHLLGPAPGVGYQVGTPVAMGAVSARILWLSGFPDQATAAAREALAFAQNSGRSFAICYVIALAGLPVAMWTGAMTEARRLLDVLADHSTGIQRMEMRVRTFSRVLRLRAGGERERLVAAFAESRTDPALISPFADPDADADIAVPLPGSAPIDRLWNAPELLRVDALLHCWHDAPGAAAAAEAMLLRAMASAREQGALSWELRAATSLARLLRDQDRMAQAAAILQPVYDRFSEGFETADLRAAKALLYSSGV